MMNAANGDLGNLILVISERVKQEELRYWWLEWARFCATDMWAVRALLSLHGREPVTESEYREREARERLELIPIEECAMLYTEYHHAWADADYETDEEGDQVPTDEAWDRVHDEMLARLRKAAADGTLKTKGKGRRLRVECGSFHDFIGEPMPVPPDQGREYEVRPDERWREVDRERKDYEFVGQLLDRGACKLDLPLDMESPLIVEDEVKGFNQETARLVAFGLKVSVVEQWRELRAVERKLETFSDEFDGEDLLVPAVRERLDDAKRRLTELHANVAEYTGPFELVEPDEELNGMIERIAEREIRHVPTR